MKKKIARAFTFVLVFVVAVIVINKMMNKGHDNLTIEIAKASLPVVTMEQAGEVYNTLYGNTQTMDVSYVRDSVTVLDEDRQVCFRVNLYNSTMNAIRYEVRTKNGDRLIENGAVTSLETQKDYLAAKVTLKDLYERNEEYQFAVILTLTDGREAIYYTTLLWSSDLHEKEKFDYIKDFHERLYNKEAAKELTKYLETNASLADNTSLYKVNIHNSFKQITWGDLKVEEAEAPKITVKDISNQLMSAILDFRVTYTSEDGNTTDYLVREYYRVRYTTDRMYLLSYERTMEQLPDAKEMYSTNNILLGIGDEEVDMLESTDGNTLVFQRTGRLFSYNTVTNNLVILFSFYEDGDYDERTLNRDYGIKILDVDEAGNVDYVVYGYMSRGNHEGRTGIWLRRYDSTTNTSKEMLFVPSDKPYSVLKDEAKRLMYLTRDSKFFFLQDRQVICADLENMTLETKSVIGSEDALLISDNQSILVWQSGSTTTNRELYLEKLGEEQMYTVSVGQDEVIKPLGFIGDDLIYGVAKKEDITKELTGDYLIPLYKLIIADYQGALQKTYQVEGMYVTDCDVEANQITLHRVELDKNGAYKTALDDHITNNVKKEEGKNKVSVVAIDLFQKYVQIQLRSAIDKKTLQILQPKDVVFEGEKELQVPQIHLDKSVYYVYGPYGVEGIFYSSSKAVQLAYEKAGSVMDSNGEVVWRRRIRSTRNQIMAIKEPQKCTAEETLAACLDTILNAEGIQRSTASLLERGQTVSQILTEGLEQYTVLDLKGCTLDTVLYYVNQEAPVLAICGNEVVLITGFNEFNVVIFEPLTGSLYKKGLNDAASWFSKYGNQFYSYSK